MAAHLSQISTNPDLYKQDYYLWLETTANLLQREKLSQLDIPNLVEEIADMGRSEKRAVYSNLKVLLTHLLKYRYQREQRSNSWRYTIEERRQRIAEAFEESPSLKGYSLEVFDKCYQDAKKLAAIETNLALEAFPPQSPFTIDEILNPDHLPD